MEAMEDDEAGGFKHSAKVPRLFKVCASIITLHEGENTCNYFNQNLDLANLAKLQKLNNLGKIR